MIVIRAPSIGYAHEQIVEKIFKDGFPKITEDNQRVLKLKEQSNIFLSSPLAEPMISSRAPPIYGKRFMDQYANDLLEGNNIPSNPDNNFAYTYHDRLFHYPIRKDDGRIEEFDQIAWIVKKLTEEPDSRRAIAITYIPGKDNYSKNPPCLQRIQCFLRENDHGEEVVDMLGNFRSNDMLTGANANMYALANLQKIKIAKPLGIGIGWYSHTSDDSHIYPKNNYDELKKMRAYDEFSLKNFEERMSELEPIYISLEKKRKARLKA